MMVAQHQLMPCPPFFATFLPTASSFCAVHHAVLPSQHGFRILGVGCGRHRCRASLSTFTRPRGRGDAAEGTGDKEEFYLKLNRRNGLEKSKLKRIRSSKPYDTIIRYLTVQEDSRACCLMCCWGFRLGAFWRCRHFVETEGSRPLPERTNNQILKQPFPKQPLLKQGPQSYRNGSFGNNCLQMAILLARHTIINATLTENYSE